MLNAVGVRVIAILKSNIVCFDIRMCVLLAVILVKFEKSYLSRLLMLLPFRFNCNIHSFINIGLGS
jgi:hypothetical protein